MMLNLICMDKNRYGHAGNDQACGRCQQSGYIDQFGRCVQCNCELATLSILNKTQFPGNQHVKTKEEKDGYTTSS